MTSEDVKILVDMGFTSTKAEKALQVTGNKGVEPAMEWLLAHANDAEPAIEPPTAESAPQAAADAPQAAADAPPEESAAGASSDASAASNARSLKCDVCGKLFKSTLEVEYHATKSGHDSFSESLEEKKPLTEDEKKEKLRMLEEKLKVKRREREEQEKKEALEKERDRIRSGKEMAEAKRKYVELEMQRLVEQRKREKEEEKAARQRVKAQIEADKAARKAKAAAESGQSPVESLPVSPPTPAVPVVSPPKQDYKETKLQIRLTNGQSLIQSFGCKEQLSAVRLFIEINRSDPPCSFNLMTSFPRKVFTEEDYEAPLDVLGLVPSAVLIVQKKVEQ